MVEGLVEFCTYSELQVDLNLILQGWKFAAAVQIFCILKERRELRSAFDFLTVAKGFKQSKLTSSSTSAFWCFRIPEISWIVTNWSIMSSHAIPKSVERFWIIFFLEDISFLEHSKEEKLFFIIIAFWVLKGSVHFEAKFKAGNSQIITTLRALNHNKKDNRAVVNYTLLCCLGLEL